MKIAERITSTVETSSHAPIRVEWHVVDCRCGWQSPLCVTREKADKLYEAHKRAKLPPQPSMSP